MSSIFETLRQVSALGAVPDEVLRASEPAWKAHHFPGGAKLWTVGTLGQGLGVLVHGRLEVTQGGAVVGQIGPGELFGEGVGFMPNHLRTTDLHCLEEAEVLVLSREMVLEYRRELPALYDALLEKALQTAATRVAAVDAAITGLAPGRDDAPERARGWTRLWQRMRSGLAGEPPPVQRALRLLPALDDAPMEVLIRIGAAMMPRRLVEDEAVFLEGDPGSACFLLVSGHVGVYRGVAAGRAERLALVGPGALLGTGALITDQPRTASCVAHESVWLYELGQEAYRDLTGAPRRVVREALMRALQQQLRTANEHLAKLHGAPESSLNEAARAITVFEGPRDLDGMAR